MNCQIVVLPSTNFMADWVVAVVVVVVSDTINGVKVNDGIVTGTVVDDSLVIIDLAVVDDDFDTEA